MIGIDTGTTAIKAAVFDPERPGRPLGMHAVPTPNRSPKPGRLEMDQAELMKAVATSVRGATQAAGGVKPIALGISGTACGAWLVDDRGRPARTAILWNDGRAVDVTTEWARAGLMGEIFAISGNVPYPGFTLPLLRWLRTHEPDVLDRSNAVLCQKDWLRLELTGDVYQDETDASYVPCDIRERRWSERLHELCDVSADAARLLPAIAPPDHTAPLLPAAAERLGLPAGVEVGLGLTDIVAATVGGGGLAAGRAVTNLGTSAFSTIVTDSPAFEPAGVGLNACAPLGRWMRTMVNTSGSMTLDWAARALTDGNVAELLALAAEAPADESPVLVPYLSPAGVVSPFAEPAARGVIAGLRSEHGPAHLARAAVDGLAAAVADCYSAFPAEPERILAVGGAVRSDLLVQRIADLSGIPVERVAGGEQGCRGAALVAAWAGGVLDGDAQLVDAAAGVECEQRFEPGSEGAGLERYREVVAANRPLWRDWTATDA